MKAYVKPDLFCEDFHLSHSVANCGMPLNHSTESCSYPLNFQGDIVTIFSASCNAGTDSYSEFCEFSGSAGGNFLTS